ncbi:MAG: PH domain-containing protein [Opitutia bacterium]
MASNDLTQHVTHKFIIPDGFERVFPAAKAKWTWVGIGSLILCYGGVIGTQSGKASGWVGVVFFGTTFLVSVIQMLPGAAYLKVGPGGIEFRTLFRTRRIAWAEISGFGHYRQASKGFVGINFEGPAKGFSRNASSALVGFHDALPDTYGHKAEELAVLLTACRAHFLRQADGSHPTEKL